MKQCTVITVTTDGNPWLKTEPDLMELGCALKGYVEKHGGECIPYCSEGVLNVAISGIPPKEIAELLAAWGKVVRQEGKEVAFVQRDEVPLPMEMAGIANRKPGALIQEKLTKRLLLSLPEGCFVVSGIVDSLTGRSVFAEQLTGFRDRVASWKRAVAVGASGRNCAVAWTEKDFDRLAGGFYGPE